MTMPFHKSNTAKGRGVKGSKFWMQIVIEKPDLQAELNHAIGEPLKWLSPLAGDDDSFREYQLTDSPILQYLGLTQAESKHLFNFWPSRQPQWDGLALSQDHGTLYLVEAKAHLSELESKCTASNPDSRTLIENGMRDVHDVCYPHGDFGAWMNHYYQLGNRLTFLHKLNAAPFGKISRVKLVLLNFVGDPTYIPTSAAEWQAHYDDVLTRMTGRPALPEHVQLILFDVSRRGFVPNPTGGEPESMNKL